MSEPTQALPKAVAFRVARALAVVVLMTFVPGWADPAQPARAAHGDYKLNNLHLQPFFREVLAAACIGWMLGLVKGLGTTKDWLGHYWQAVPAFILLLGDLFL